LCDRLFCADKEIEAADLLREGVSSYPCNLDLWEHLLICLGNAHEYGEFLATYRKYLAMGGKAIPVRVWHAISLKQVGKPDAAVTEVESIEQEDRLELNDGIQAMRCLISLARPKKTRAAVSALGLKIAQKLVALYPDEAAPQFAIGFWMSTPRKCSKKALACLARAVELAPERHDFRSYHANCLYEMKRYPEALTEWEKIPLGEIDCQTALGRMVALYESVEAHEKAAACQARLKKTEEANSTSLSDADIQRLMGALT
jgi:tetratricopeptide (TPR) repeat protein